MEVRRDEAWELAIHFGSTRLVYRGIEGGVAIAIAIIIDRARQSMNAVNQKASDGKEQELERHVVHRSRYRVYLWVLDEQVFPGC